jgi:hypothetical protein
MGENLHSVGSQLPALTRAIPEVSGKLCDTAGGV